MLTNLYFDNIEGIDAPIELDLFSKWQRVKSSNRQFYIPSEEVAINKVIGLLGSNSSGKTSFINAVRIFKNLIKKPLLDKSFEDEYSNFLLNQDVTNNETARALREIYRNKLHSTANPKIQSAKRMDYPSIFRVELYSDAKEYYEGFYTYELVVSGIDNIIVSERLMYQKKRFSIPKIIIEARSIKQTQVSYIYNNYNNIEELSTNLKLDFDNALKDKSEYVNIFMHEFIDSVKVASNIDFGFPTEINNSMIKNLYSNYPKELEKIISIIDPNIKKIELDMNEEHPIVKFYIDDKNYLRISQLSKGTIRLLNLLNGILVFIDEDKNKKDGFKTSSEIIFIDELEQNLNADVVELILGLFNDKNNYHRQLVFTTLNPDIFDLKNSDKTRLIKLDAGYVFDRDEKGIVLNRLNEIQMGESKVRTDSVIGNLFRQKKLSLHPDIVKIKDFVRSVNK